MEKTNIAARLFTDAVKYVAVKKELLLKEIREDVVMYKTDGN